MLYLKYLKKSLLSTFVGHIVWISLSTYVVINKSTIGIDNIPIFEVILFLAGLISSRIATMNIFSFKIAMYSSALVETLFLLILSIAIYYNGVSIMSGVILYLLIIAMNGFISPIESESRRILEDKKLKKDSEKNYLRIIRGYERNWRMIGASIGSILSLIFLSYLEIRLEIFTLAMLGLNILQNMYDLKLINKYL